MITNFFISELNNHDVQELWFQQDGATCHTARATIDLLKDTFGDRLISRFGPVNWPPRSCDLTPLDYFLWGYVKSLVYVDYPQTLDHLEDNIRHVIADIRPQCWKKSSKIGLHPSQPWQSAVEDVPDHCPFLVYATDIGWTATDRPYPGKFCPPLLSRERSYPKRRPKSSVSIYFNYVRPVVTNPDLSSRFGSLSKVKRNSSLKSTKAPCCLVHVECYLV
ncbi:uncharacterized protein TNCV_114621 [Trichonephila clavipes]|nr:uncharacterized protein TNCV_114621 [Trichonephila clavipes]